MGVLDAERAAEEVRSIRAEDRWPLWPVLPMKNLLRGGMMTKDGLGIKVAGETKVFLTNLFALHSGPIKEQLRDVECEEFDSVEAMVAAGWVGD